MGKFGLIAGLIFLCATGALAQSVQGIHANISSSPLQLGVGYTFVAFQASPSSTKYQNGVDASVVYYQDWIGVEGDFSDGFGTSAGKNTQLLFGGGGLRVRWQRPMAFEPWAHLVVGGAHLTPKIANDVSGFGFKLGAGADFRPQRSPVALRVSVDMLTTQLFGTYQVSPEASAGIVLSLGRH